MREDYSATATPGTTSATTRRGRARTAGARTAWRASRDDQQLLCFALALWNGNDPILKERLFGLTNSEGNHGEDVKEYYFYLDSTPTHSYMKYLYKYPQAAYPYADLVETNRAARPDRARVRAARHRRLRRGPLLRRLRRVRQGLARRHPDPDHRRTTADRRPRRCICCRRCGSATPGPAGDRSASDTAAQHRAAAVDAPCASAARQLVLFCEGAPDAALHRERDQHRARLGMPNPTPYVKDGFNDCIVNGRRDAVNPRQAGTKAAAHYRLDSRRRRHAESCACDCATAPRGRHDRPFGRRSTPSWTRGGAKPTSSTPAVIPASVATTSQRHASGAGRNAVVEAVLQLRRRQMARASTAPIRSSRRSRAARNERVAPHVQRGHHLDAGQMGVPVVRGLGPGVPRHRR